MESLLFVQEQAVDELWLSTGMTFLGALEIHFAASLWSPQQRDYFGALLLVRGVL
jgi:hypothetical protein